MRKSLDRGIAALLVVGFYYNSYRYPLQINDSGTSPTYSDTPAWLSFPKYLLVALLLGYLLIGRLALRERLRVRRPVHLIGYLFLALLPVASGVVSRRLDFFTLGFFFLVPVVLLLFSGATLSYARLNRLLAATVWIALVTEAVQVALFLTVGRLPALAFYESFAVRFGSFLDDPNGFGLLVSWLTPFAFVYFRGVPRFVAMLGLVASLLLSQSLTAVATFLLVGLLLTALYVRENPRAILPASVLVLLTGIVVGTPLYLFRRELLLAYDVYMQMKRGSIEDHAQVFEMLGDIRLLNFLGIEPLVDRWTETGYVNLLAYFGVGFLAVYLLLGAFAVAWYVRLYRGRERTRDEKCFGFGALGLLGVVYLGNLNLPVVTIFPLDLFAALALGIASAGFRPAETGAAATSRERAGAPAGPLEISVPDGAR